MERALARQHLVEDGAEGKMSERGSARLPAHLLGRHVADRAHHVPGRRCSVRLVDGLQIRRRVQSIVLRQLGETEVENLDAAVVR